MTPAALGRSCCLHKDLRHSLGQQRAEGFTGTRHRGTIHTASHKFLRPTTCNSTHRREQQTIPVETWNQAGRPTQHALGQLTLREHHEPATEKCNGGHHVVRRVEHDRDTNFSNLMFADHILLIRPWETMSSRPQRHTACNNTPREQESSPTRHQKTETLFKG